MSLLIRLDKLNKDVTLSDDEKYGVFQELIHSFLAKSNFNDFKTTLNYYQFKEETLYECLTRCIEQDKIIFVKQLTYDYKKSLKEKGGIYNVIPITFENIKYSIFKEKIEILKYLLNQCSKNIINDSILFSTNNKEILKILINYGINPEPKLDIIIHKCSLTNKMCECIDKWCSRGDIYSLKYFGNYIENYINLCCLERKNDESLKILNIMKVNLEKIEKKEYSYKLIFLQNFYQFLEQNNEKDISRINNILMNI